MEFLKSNLQYLKTCIPSIRKNAYRGDHDIIVFVDSDEDGTVEWLSEVKEQYSLQYYINPKLGDELYGIGLAYDFCIEKSSTDVFMIFHADMMLGKNADLNAFQHLQSHFGNFKNNLRTVVCSTRVEPPLHPNNGEKILEDFGMWPEEFKETEFDEYVESQLSSTKTTNGIFAPWMMFKKEFQHIGGHDPMLHSCREDSDVFNRLKLAGFNFVQPWNSLVYHLTGRGAGSFSGDAPRHEAWQKQMNNSTREFIRKWGSLPRHSPELHPIVVPKYETLLCLRGANMEALAELEPHFTFIAVDFDPAPYIDAEQPHTSFTLKNRVKKLESLPSANITITADASALSTQDVNILKNLNEVIVSHQLQGNVRLGSLEIQIKDLASSENKLIRI